MLRKERQMPEHETTTVSPAAPDRPGPRCETSEDYATDAAIHDRPYGENKTTITLPLETWHKANMEMIWTDSGKVGVRFTNRRGVVTQYFSADPREVEGMAREWKNR